MFLDVFFHWVLAPPTKYSCQCVVAKVDILLGGKARIPVSAILALTVNTSVLLARIRKELSVNFPSFLCTCNTVGICLFSGSKVLGSHTFSAISPISFVLSVPCPLGWRMMFINQEIGSCWVAEQLRVLAILTENLVHFPASTLYISPVTPLPGNSVPSSGFHRHLYNMVHMHTLNNTHIHIK